MESEFRIDIFDIMQTSTPAGRTNEDGSPAGSTILNLICDNWDKYEKINVSFEGIAQMTRPFLDEAFGKVLDIHSLDEFNAKLYFPDAGDQIVKALNGAIKLRLSIIKAAKERKSSAADGF